MSKHQVKLNIVGLLKTFYIFFQNIESFTSIEGELLQQALAQTKSPVTIKSINSNLKCREYRKKGDNITLEKVG